MSVFAVQLVLAVMIALGSYYIGTLHGAEEPEKELAARDRQLQDRNREYDEAVQSVDNLITELLNKPLPEAPRIKEVVKYVRIKESAERECLADDTVRMLNGIRHGGRQESADSPRSAGTTPGTAPDSKGSAVGNVK